MATEYSAARFLEDRGESPRHVSRMALWAEYRDAVEILGVRRPMTRNRFYAALADLGTTVVTVRGVRCFRLPAAPLRECRVCCTPFRTFDASRTLCGPADCLEWEAARRQWAATHERARA